MGRRAAEIIRLQEAAVLRGVWPIESLKCSEETDSSLYVPSGTVAAPRNSETRRFFGRANTLIHRRPEGSLEFGVAHVADAAAAAPPPTARGGGRMAAWAALHANASWRASIGRGVLN
ncbi:unnamed protein product [Prorocentrum cordatum]|uniref:Uncharacterized protein n=1 Tax=Prorocentrum cordatum TaxID=2364126 RepID=A0ABN9QTL6_9DINO|nr:unnamed protein product [Polarella glacialis]